MTTSLYTNRTKLTDWDEIVYYRTMFNIYTGLMYSLYDIYTIIAQCIVTETSIKLMFSDRTLDLYL